MALRVNEQFIHLFGCVPKDDATWKYLRREASDAGPFLAQLKRDLEKKVKNGCTFSKICLDWLEEQERFDLHPDLLRLLAEFQAGFVTLMHNPEGGQPLGRAGVLRLGAPMEWPTHFNPLGGRKISFEGPYREFHMAGRICEHPGVALRSASTVKLDGLTAKTASFRLANTPSIELTDSTIGQLEIHGDYYTLRSPNTEIGDATLKNGQVHRLELSSERVWIDQLTVRHGSVSSLQANVKDLTVNEGRFGLGVGYSGSLNHPPKLKMGGNWQICDGGSLTVTLASGATVVLDESFQCGDTDRLSMGAVTKRFFVDARAVTDPELIQRFPVQEAFVSSRDFAGRPGFLGRRKAPLITVEGKQVFWRHPKERHIHVQLPESWAQES